MHSTSEPFFVSSRFRIYVLSGAIILALILTASKFWTSFDDSRSRVTMSRTASPAVTIATPKLMDLETLSYEQLLALRVTQVNQHADLLNGQNYRPTPFVFRGLQEPGRWAHVDELLLGRTELGEMKPFFPESLASRSILAPFLLVKVDFWDYTPWGTLGFAWNESTPSFFETLKKNAIALSPTEENIRIEPARAAGSVLYDVSKFLNDSSEYLKVPVKDKPFRISLAMQNAYDLGFRFASLDIAGSKNFSFPEKSGEVIELAEYFGTFVPSWSKTGVRFQSEAHPAFANLECKGLPAKIKIDLWNDQPAPSQAPDFSFTPELK